MKYFSTLTILFTLYLFSASLFASESATEVILSRNSSLWEKTFQVEKRGESFLAITLSSPDTSWRSSDSKSVVLKVSTDGRHYADIILFGGSEAIEYTAYAGEAAPGARRISVEFDAVRSPAQDARVFVHSAELKTVGENDENYLAYKYSPLVYPRGGSAVSDAPLLMYCNPVGDARMVTLEYQVVFSNEDGGTGGNAPILMVQWGRTTDIEWVYQVKVDRKSGKIIYETYQGEKHATKLFSGKKVNSHPVLRVTTRNNNFDQEGEEAILSGLMPVIFTQGERTREVFMDEHPWTHRIANEEMFAEKKAVPSSFGAYYEMGDARNYLYIDYNGRNNTAKRNLEFMVKMKGDEKWYGSDPEILLPLVDNPGKLERGGRCRTNVELPPGATPEAVEKIRLDGLAGGDFNIYEIKAFFLDANYVPGPYFLDFKGDIHLTDANNGVELPVGADKP